MNSSKRYASPSVLVSKATPSGRTRFTATFPDGRTVSTVSGIGYTHAVLAPHDGSWRVAEWFADEKAAAQWAGSRDSMETVIVPVTGKHSNVSIPTSA